MTALDTLIDFATYLGLENQMYIDYSTTSGFTLCNHKSTDVNILLQLADAAYNECSNDIIKQNEYTCAISRITQYLQYKVRTNLLQYIIYRLLGLHTKIKHINNLCLGFKTYPTTSLSPIHKNRIARINFFQKFKQHRSRLFSPGLFKRLWGIKRGDSDEHKMIQLISNEIYKRTLHHPSLQYEHVMNEFMNGSHLVFIQSNRSKDNLMFDKLTTLDSCMHNQESSHYKLDGKTNPKNHYRKNGELISHLLMSNTPMALVNDELIHGQSYNYVKTLYPEAELVSAVQIQTENFPDYGEVTSQVLPPLMKSSQSFKHYVGTTLYNYFTWTLPDQRW